MLAIAIGTAASAAIWQSGFFPEARGAESDAATEVVNPFHGTYEGGFWTNNVPGVGPFGGDIKCTVSSAGVATITVPGAGTGTVSAVGAFKVTGKLTVRGKIIPVTYTGSVSTLTVGTKSIAIGFGTWSAPLVSATGKWEVHRTKLTP